MATSRKLTIVVDELADHDRAGWIGEVGFRRYADDRRDDVRHERVYDRAERGAMMAPPRGSMALRGR
jgi:hypothetical protein